MPKALAESSYLKVESYIYTYIQYSIIYICTYIYIYICGPGAIVSGILEVYIYVAG